MQSVQIKCFVRIRIFADQIKRFTVFKYGKILTRKKIRIWTIFKHFQKKLTYTYLKSKSKVNYLTRDFLPKRDTKLNAKFNVSITNFLNLNIFPP